MGAVRPRFWPLIWGVSSWLDDIEAQSKRRIVTRTTAMTGVCLVTGLQRRLITVFHSVNLSSFL